MKRVLILCTGNSCRSQMAEGLWEKLGGGEWESRSAGSKPSGYVHPLAVKAMTEEGIDIGQNRSKSVQEFEGETFDLVVTVCGNAKDSCPVFLNGRKTFHWPFDDPADATGTDDEKMVMFRRVRDEIAGTIRNYLNSKN